MKDAKKMTMEEIVAAHGKAIAAFNKALAARNEEAGLRADLDIRDLEGAYAEKAEAACLEALLDEAKPFEAAVRMFSFAVLSHKDSKEGEREAIEKAKRIPLLKLNTLGAQKGVQVGVSPDWTRKIERLGQYLTQQVAMSVGFDRKTVHDTYKLSKETERVAENAKASDLLGLLQEVVTACIGDKYTATKYDAGFVRETFAKEGAKHTVKSGTLKSTTSICANAMSRIIAGAEYSVKFAAVKPEATNA